MLNFNYWNMLFNIINILVLFAFFKRFLFKPVNAIIEKRSNAITSSLQDADNKKSEAYKLKSDYEEELRNAGDQASVILKEARERAELEYNKKLQEAKSDATKVMEEAQRSIELERKKSMESAQAEIAGIAMLAAAKVISKNVDDDTNQKYLGDFLKEVGASK